MPDNSHIVSGTTLSQPIITDASGTPIFHANPSGITSLRVHRDDIEEFCRVMGVNPRPTLNDLNVDEEEDISEETEGAGRVAEFLVQFSTNSE